MQSRSTALGLECRKSGRVTTDMFQGHVLWHAKRSCDHLFNAALETVSDPNVDPSYWFFSESHCLPWLGDTEYYHEFRQYVEDAETWLRLNHPARGVWVPTGIYSHNDYEVH